MAKKSIAPSVTSDYQRGAQYACDRTNALLREGKSLAEAQAVILDELNPVQAPVESPVEDGAA